MGFEHIFLPTLLVAALDTSNLYLYDKQLFIMKTNTRRMQGIVGMSLNWPVEKLD